MTIRFFFKTLLTLFLVIPVCFLQAQHNGASSYAVVKGKVVARATGKPLPFVNVFVKSLQLGGVSNRDGLFLIEKLPPGVYDVVFQRQGYETITRTKVKVQGGGSIILDAEMAETILEGDDVVVTATRSAEFEADVPQLVSIVTSKEIRDKNISQTPELLKEEEGVYIQKTNNGGGSPVIRGLKANKLLLLIDGIRLNNATYRGGNLQYLNTINAQSLDKIEVVHGPVSALYGSDALGGAVNVITKNPIMPYAENMQWNAGVTTLASTADGRRSAAGSLSFGNKKFGLLLDGAYKSYGDVRRGTSGGETLMQRLLNDSRRDRIAPEKQGPNAFDAYDFTSKLVYKSSPVDEFTVLFQLNRQPSVPRYDVFETQRFEQWSYEPQERDFGYVSYKNSHKNALFNYMTANVSYQRQSERRLKRRPGRETRTSEAFETTTLGGQVQFNRLIKDHFIAYGFEFYRDGVDAESFEINIADNASTPITTLYPDNSRYLSFGAFTEAEFTLNSRWIVDLGLRYSAFDLSAPFAAGTTGGFDIGTVEQSPSAVTASIATRFRISDGINFVGNIAQGFRAPNLDDVSKLGEGSGGSFYDVPNAAAGPEKLLSFDGGVKIKRGGLRGNFIGFYSDVSDVLVRRQTTFGGLPFLVVESDTFAVFHKENAGTAYVTGLEMSLKYLLNRNLSVLGNLSYTYGQNTTDETPLNAMPPVNGLLSLRYEKSNYWLEGFTRFTREQDRLAPDDMEDLRIPEGGTPGWYTLNLRGGAPLTENLTLRLSATNLLNRNYREHLSGFNAPGRNFILSVDARF